MFTMTASLNDQPKAPTLRLVMTGVSALADATARGVVLGLTTTYYATHTLVVIALFFTVCRNPQSAADLGPLILFQTAATLFLVAQLMKLTLNAILACIINAMLGACGLRPKSEIRPMEADISRVVFELMFIRFLAFAVVDSSILTYLLQTGSLCQATLLSKPDDCTIANFIVALSWTKVVPAFTGLVANHVLPSSS